MPETRKGEQLPTHSVVIPYEKTLGGEAVKQAFCKAPCIFPRIVIYCYVDDYRACAVRQEGNGNEIQVYQRTYPKKDKRR